MSAESCELLLDGLFASVSDLQTHIIETLISRHTLEHKVDCLQLAVLSFKTSFLKILAEGLSWLQQPPTESSTGSTAYLAPLYGRLKELERRRCILQLRNLLKGKVEKELGQLNLSVSNMTPQKVHEEESRLERLAESVVKMQKDLGIEEAERSYFARGNFSVSHHEFVSRIEDSDEEAGDHPGKRSFLTSSNVSLLKNNLASQSRLIDGLAGPLQSSFRKILSTGFNTIKEASKKCTCKSSSKEPPQQNQPPATPHSQSGQKLKQQSSNSLSKQTKPTTSRTKQQISRKANQDTKRNFPQSKPQKDKGRKIPSTQTGSKASTGPRKPEGAGSVFHNILKETYESMSKQP